MVSQKTKEKGSWTKKVWKIQLDLLLDWCVCHFRLFFGFPHAHLCSTNSILPLLLYLGLVMTWVIVVGKSLSDSLAGLHTTRNASRLLWGSLSSTWLYTGVSLSLLSGFRPHIDWTIITFPFSCQRLCLQSADGPVLRQHGRSVFFFACFFFYPDSKSITNKSPIEEKMDETVQLRKKK